MDRTRVSTTLDPAPPGSPVCHNCGAALTGPFCSGCGQKDVPLDRRLGQVLRDWLEEVASLDSRLLRTLFILFFRPGRLTIDYNEGRRVRYVPPLRLYMVASVLFFFVLALTPGFTELDGGEGDGSVEVGVTDLGDDEPERTGDAGTDATPRADEAGPDDIEPSTGTASSRSSTATTGEAADSADSGFDAWLLEQGERAESDPRGFAQFWVRVLAWSMFVVLPIAALLLAGVYRRPKRLYVRHLVFTLHTHAFAFLLLALASTVDVMVNRGNPDGTSTTALIGIGVALVYFYLALLRAYGDGIIRTAFKFCVLGLAYSIALSVVMTASIFVALGLF